MGDAQYKSKKSSDTSYADIKNLWYSKKFRFQPNREEMLS